MQFLVIMSFCCLKAEISAQHEEPQHLEAANLSGCEAVSEAERRSSLCPQSIRRCVRTNPRIRAHNQKYPFQQAAQNGTGGNRGTFFASSEPQRLLLMFSSLTQKAAHRMGQSRLQFSNQSTWRDAACSSLENEGTDSLRVILIRKNPERRCEVLTTEPLLSHYLKTQLLPRGWCS